MESKIKANAIYIGFIQGKEEIFIAQLKEFTLNNRRAEDFGAMVIKAVRECREDEKVILSDPILVAFVPDHIEDWD